MRKRIAKHAAAFVSLCILACASGCFLVAHDSETREPPPVDDFLIYWAVVDEGTGAELTRGCGLSTDRSKKIRFKAPIESHVVETVLFERVAKESGSVPSFSSFEAEDAFWCGKDHDVDRLPYRLKLDIGCVQALQDRPPAKILSRETVEAGPNGGYRLGLEIIGTGTLMYESIPDCPMSSGAELTVLRP